VFRFSLRELILLTAVVALCVCFYAERSSTKPLRHEFLQLEREREVLHAKLERLGFTISIVRVNGEFEGLSLRPTGNQIK
jgi:hypothetical protein